MSRKKLSKLPKNTKVGERIREIRKQKELTLKEMSGRLNYSFAYISDIERGKVEPSREFLMRLNEIFGVSSDYILYGSPAARVEDLIMKNKLKHDRLKEFKAIPADSVSEDEEAILRVLRNIEQEDSLLFLRLLLIKGEKRKEDYPFTFLRPFQKSIERIKDMVKNEKWGKGADYESLLWSLDRLQESIKDGKKSSN